MRLVCSLQNLRRRIPIWNWLPKYQGRYLFSDFLAGITVSLTVIPQGIAYAAVAGLPLQYGLYTAFMAPLILVFFSTVPAVTLGPTAVMALMSLPYVTVLGPEVAGLLSLLAGMFILLCGLLNLGFLTELISGTVLAGFCSAAATRIITMQLRQLLGLKIPGNGFLDVLQGIVLRIQEIKIPDFVLGLFTIVLIIVLKNLSEIFKKCRIENQLVYKIAWFFSVSRNAIAISVGCITSLVLELNGNNLLSLTGFIQPGIPNFQLPLFSFNLSSTNLGSNSSDAGVGEPVTLNFIGSLEHLGVGLVLLAVVSILEHIAIAKAISSGQSVDSSQELCSLGMANIFGSFVGAFPVTASFARSAVQKSSGAKTPLCNFFVCVIVLLSIAFMTDVFYYIPKASLAAVIITAVAPMIEYHEVPYLWKISKVELIPFFATFFVCLLSSIEMGIIVGAAIHLLIVAFHTTRKAPKISRNQEDEVVLMPQRSLYFSGVEMLRSSVEKVLTKQSPVRLTVDFANVSYVDATSMKALESVFASAYKGVNVIRIRNLKLKIRNSILSGLGPDCMLLKGQLSCGSGLSKSEDGL